MNQAVIVTNNDKVYQKHQGRLAVLFLPDGDYLAVLEKARDLIHQGAALLSHPQSGSMKPNQTPYRSVLLSWESPAAEGGRRPTPTDTESVLLIESSIETARKFLAAKKTPPWPAAVKEDFKTVDLSIIDSAI